LSGSACSRNYPREYKSKVMETGSIRLTVPAVTGLRVIGNGPAAKTMPVKPADQTCGSMTKHSDPYLIDIIAKGGTRAGKSAQRDNLQGSVRAK